MKIGIYTPYLDSFGGGERYVLTIAEVLSADNDVDLLVDKHQLSLDAKNLKNELGRYFNLDLSKTKLVAAPIGKESSFFKRIFFLRQYDLLFYLTDGSIFYSTARKNIIHFQVPFENLGGKNLWGRIKLSSWDIAIFNSRFTKSYIEKWWPIKGQVIYPPVDVMKIVPLQKRKYILSVGRFASFTKSKKHEEMIEVFARIFKTGKISDWSLHLAGSVEGDENYVGQLRLQAKDLPVFFYPDLKFSELVKLYGCSSIYWHAAGIGETDPKKLEHFGITTVEAMAGGCVPVVIHEGGQPEIVEDGKSGLLWDSIDKLQELTLKLIGDTTLMTKLSKKSIERSRLFSKKSFEESIQKLVKSIYGSK